MDNPFIVPSDGEADWDSSLNADLHTVDRGYHVTERAGTAINTGAIVWLNATGFFVPFDPNSAAIFPYAMAYTAAASGDSMTALAWGIMRSLAINSIAQPGHDIFVSALTPGLISATSFGPKVGRGLSFDGVLFNPQFGGGAAAAATKLASLTDVDTTGVADGKVLTWSDTSSKWKPATPGGGGGGGVTSSYLVNAVGSAGWDPNYVATGKVTFSASNQIAIMQGSDRNHIYGQPAHQDGLRYFEYIIGNDVGNGLFGFCGAPGHAFNANNQAFGNANIPTQIGWFNTGVIFMTQAAGVINNGSYTIATYTSSARLCFALDWTHRKFWCRVNTAGTWNNSASNDPGTNAGGMDLNYAFIGVTEPWIWPGISYSVTSYQVELLMNSADIGARLPAGFQAWNS